MSFIILNTQMTQNLWKTVQNDMPKTMKIQARPRQTWISNIQTTKSRTQFNTRGIRLVQKKQYEFLFKYNIDFFYQQRHIVLS